jgi:hypothetical protein
MYFIYLFIYSFFLNLVTEKSPQKILFTILKKKSPFRRIEISLFGEIHPGKKKTPQPCIYAVACYGRHTESGTAYLVA